MRHDDETAFLRALSPEGLEALSKALGSLRSLGCIETGRRRITILGVPGLRKRAV
jgi:hypothetical protein